MDKIKDQSRKVGELIFSTDTGATYSRALNLTWDILRETGLLLWLVICLVFVGAEWFWKTSINLGNNARDWYEGLKQPSNEEPKSATEIGQSMVSVLTSSTANLLYQAKQQLGIEATPPVQKPATPKANVHPQPSTTPIPQEAKATVAVSAEKVTATEQVTKVEAEAASVDNEE